MRDANEEPACHDGPVVGGQVGQDVAKEVNHVHHQQGRAAAKAFKKHIYKKIDFFPFLFANSLVVGDSPDETPDDIPYPEGLVEGGGAVVLVANPVHLRYIL